MWKFGGLEIKSLGRKCELGGGQKRRGRRVEFVEKMIYLYSHYSCVSSMMLICVCSAWVLGDLFVCDHRFLIILYVMAMLRCSDFGVSLRRAQKIPFSRIYRRRIWPWFVEFLHWSWARLSTSRRVLEIMPLDTAHLRGGLSYLMPVVLLANKIMT